MKRAVTSAQLRRAAGFFIAPAVCLILFWRVPGTWFLNDDFAWLGMYLDVHSLRDFFHLLFVPKAQGTIRVLSERLFFLSFSPIFGLHVLPYRLWVLGTWFADLTLVNLIGARLTGSRAAGVFAALLCAASACLITPLVWASAYNEVLCAFCILAAFYARLRWLESGGRKWRAAEWAAYLAGFGALEIIVMYPAVAALHALAIARKRFRSTLPLFVPAIAFTFLHLFFIPVVAGRYYTVAVDRRLPVDFLRYVGWALAPSQLGDISLWMRSMTAASIGVTLAVFVIWRLRRQEFLALFCVGWFVLLLAPVLPLPDHVVDYYLTMPIIGLAWLGGWAIAAAWRTDWSARAITLVLMALYLRGSVREINIDTRWYAQSAARMRSVVLGLEQATRAHPAPIAMLLGVDNDLFQSGFEDNPFRLFGVRVYLAGSTEGIVARPDLGGIARFTMAPSQELRLLEAGQTRAFSVMPNGVFDITAQYTTTLRADPAASRHDFVNTADPAFAELLGPTWYREEEGFRWMPRAATVKLSGPSSPSQRLYVTGYAPGAVLASGPVTLRFRADGEPIGSSTLRQPEGMFSMNFPLPAGLTGRATIEISIEASKVIVAGKRELGMVFGTFAIR